MTSPPTAQINACEIITIGTKTPPTGTHVTRKWKLHFTYDKVKTS